MCDKECASIEIEEHTECKCACALSPRDCTERQQFVSSECACKCTNTNERRECYESGKVWNPSSCACTCPAHKCSLGAHLDELTCMCAAIVDFNERSLLNLTNVELMSLEVLIIIFLVSTVTGDKLISLKGVFAKNERGYIGVMLKISAFDRC